MSRQVPPGAGLGSAEPLAVSPDPSGQAALDDEGEVAGYFVGQCGHPAPLVGPVWRVGPCEDCGAGRPRA